MARKIRLDFSKVEERSGWKTTSMPEGLHEMKVELVDDRDANDGTKMLTYGLRPTNPKYKTRLFPYYCKQQANQYFKLRDLHIAAGVLDPKKAKGKAVDIYPDAPIGKLVAAEVVDGRNPQYSDRSEIDGVYNVDILEDEDGIEPDDDDEEYDDEEEVDEDEGEDEEEDDEDEDLEALSLPELRKRAKDLGIATAGLKKADLIDAILDEDGDEEDDEDEDELDDDDLDDEDLEDEEFEDDEEDEDEEEEEEPAPKRRAPAKKAPAKAAPAAAKRSVRRR